MIPLLVIVDQVFSQGSLPSTDADAAHPAQAFRFDTSDPSFCEGIEIRAVGGDLHGLYASGKQDLIEGGLIDLVVVPDQVLATTMVARKGVPLRLQKGIAYIYVIFGDGTVAYSPKEIPGRVGEVKHTNLTSGREAVIGGEWEYSQARGGWVSSDNSGRYSAKYPQLVSLFSKVQLDAMVRFLRWFDPEVDFLHE